MSFVILSAPGEDPMSLWSICNQIQSKTYKQTPHSSSLAFQCFINSNSSINLHPVTLHSVILTEDNIWIHWEYITLNTIGTFYNLWCLMSKIISCRMFCRSQLGNVLHNYENSGPRILRSFTRAIFARFWQTADWIEIERGVQIKFNSVIATTLKISTAPAGKKHKHKTTHTI